MSIEGNHDVIVPSSVSDRKSLKIALTEMTYCLQRMDDERSAMKDINDTIHEKYGLPKKLVSKLARTMYKRDYANITQENEDFELLYETLVEGNKLAEIASDLMDVDNITADSASHNQEH